MPILQEPAKIAKAVLQGVIESTVGTDPGTGYVDIPVYNVGPLVTPSVEIIELNPAVDSLTRGPVLTGPGTNLFGFQTYMYADPDNVGLAPWQQVPLPICGFLGGAWGGSTAPADPTGVVAGSGTGLTGDYGYVITTYDLTTGIESQVSGEEVSATTLADEDAEVSFANPGAGKRTFIYRGLTGVTGGPWYFCGALDGDAGGAQTYVDSLPDAQLDTGRTPPTGTDVAFADAGYQWLPLSSGFVSATMRGYLDGHRRNGVGSRGGFREVGAAGRSVEMNWEIQTRYVQATLKLDNPAGPTYPDQPPRLEAASSFLRPRKGTFTVASGGTPMALGHDLWPWCLKRYEFSPGTQVRPRRCANANEGIRELLIHQRYQSELTMVFETPHGSASGDDAFDPVQDMKAGVIYNASWVIGGSTTLGRLRRSFPALQLIEAPVFVDEDEGVRCYSARFGCLDMYKNDWARLVQY